jgi:hypothetical protein
MPSQRRPSARWRVPVAVFGRCDAHFLNRAVDCAFGPNGFASERIVTGPLDGSGAGGYGWERTTYWRGACVKQPRRSGQDIIKY